MRKTWRWHAATATPASAYPAVPLAAASTASAAAPSPSLTPASSTTSASSAAASVVLPPANGVKINLIECEMKFVLTHTHSSTHTQTHTAVHTHLQQYSHTHTAATGAALHPHKLSLSRRTAVHSFRIVSPNSPRLDKRSQLPNTFSPSPSPPFALPLTKDSFDTSTMCRAYFACLRHVPLPLPLCSAPLNGLA